MIHAACIHVHFNLVASQDPVLLHPRCKSNVRLNACATDDDVHPHIDSLYVFLYLSKKLLLQVP